MDAFIGFLILYKQYMIGSWESILSFLDLIYSILEWDSGEGKLCWKPYAQK